ncbi:MAG: LysM peptidoglycan-binding domain-containing protein [Bdellovibrionales bacterium]|nr:LysM peptidoglycan-binding domain-containing protein [Bdellovibrionales bacterium]
MKLKKVVWFSLLMISLNVFAQDEVDADLDVTTEVIESDTSEISPSSNQEVMMTGEGSVQSFSVDKVYIIQSGDTLWDICSLLLDDPYYWPKLWSLNQYIKNPHLIYPGNQLVFTPGTESSFPNLEIVQDTDEDEPMTFEVVQGEKKEKKSPKAGLYQEVDNPFGETVVEKNIATGQGVSVRLINRNLLTPSHVPTVGRITHSGEPKKQLVFNDRVYVDFFRSDYRDDIQVGTKFFVIEKIKKVSDPDGGRLGTFVKKKGVMQVTDIRKSPRNARKKVFEGIILDADEALERGDELIEYRPEIRNLVPHYTDELIKGKIAEADNLQMMISNNDFVFLNIGSKDGLKDGVQLYVVRRGDGLDMGHDKNLPDVPVGRVMIVETWDTVSTAYVVSLEQALEVGDRVTTVIE